MSGVFSSGKQPAALAWGGPVSTDGLELAISISDLFSSSSLLIRTPGASPQRGLPRKRQKAASEF